jgi:hypothetical protein
LTKVLAVRTRDGFYLEFSHLTAKTQDGEQISFSLDDCNFAQVLDVDDARRWIPESAEMAAQNGSTDRKPTLHRVDASGIDSEEEIGQPGG